MHYTTAAPLDAKFLEACLGVFGIKDICHFTLGIWDTVFNILVTFRDIVNLVKLIMGIFASL